MPISQDFLMLIGSSRRFRVCSVLVLSAYVLAGCGVASAQDGVVKKDAKKGAVAGTTRAVFFNEDRELGARLRKAAQLRMAGRLQQAFDLYLWVLESGDEVLFRLDDNRFCDVRDYCMRHIGELPKEYLVQYRLRTDGEVSRLFEEEKGRGAAEAIESLGLRYFLSSHGPEILDYAGDVYAGRGAYPQAAACWRRMLKWGGDRVSRALIETKLALALARYGEIREARRLLSVLRTRDPDARLTLGGREIVVVDYLSETLPKVGVVVRRTEVKRDHWPQLGGEGGHGASMPADFNCDVKVGDFIIPGYDWKMTVPQTGRRVVTSRNLNLRQLVGFAPFVPVYANGKVFIHDDKGLMAFRLNAISESWHLGEMGVPGTNVARSGYTGGLGIRAYVCAWADGVVYASLSKGRDGVEVWAVSDRGKLLWRATKSQVGFEWLSGVAGITDPVVLDGSVFFCVWQGHQWRHDCTLVSVDAATGKLNWRRFICSGARTPTYYYGRYLGARPTVNVPAAKDGVVVVCSDLGGVAAVDARSGDLRWGFAYEQRALGYRHVMINRGRGTFPSAACVSSTPVIHEGVAYVTPQDSAGLYAIDVATGRCLWRIPRGEYGTIVGISGDRLILSGKVAAALDAFTGTVAWTSQDEGIAATGTGFITSDAVYIPAKKAIYRLDADTGKVLGRLLVNQQAEEFGNLLLVEDTMLQLGKRANFYGLWDRVYAKLDAQIKRDPKNPEPHIRLGAIYARKEDRARATSAYERALRLMVADDTKESARLREELRKRLYDLYTAEIKQALDAERTDRALTLALRNRDYATTDARKIAVVNTLIDIYGKRDDWTNVVRQYQSFLTHPPKVVYAFEGDSEMLPALYARLKIRELIAKHGRRVYAEFDAAATRLYRAGKRETLEQVVRVYPNATATLRALAKLSEAEAAIGSYRRAARYLTEYLRYAGDDARDVVTMRWRLATYHERDKRYGTARRLFEHMAKTYPTATVNDGGRRVTVKTAVAERLGRAVYRDSLVRVTRGDFRAPMRQTMKVPVGGRPVEVTGSDAVLMLGAQGRLSCLEGHGGKPLWQTSVDASYVAGAEVRGDRLMVCGRKAVKLIAMDTGKVLWSYSVGNPIGKALNRRVVTQNIVGAAFDDRYVAVNVGGSRQELVLLDANAGGKPVWKKRLTAGPVWAPLLWQDRVAVTTVNGLAAFDVATGEQILQLRVQRPRRAGLVLDDGRLFVCGMTSLQCIDLAERKQLWSRPYRFYYSNYLSGSQLVRINGRDCFVAHTTDRKVMCVDLEDGRAVWSKTVGEGRDRPVGVRIAEDSVYVLIMRSSGTERQVRLVQLALKTGKQGWQSMPISTEIKEGSLMVSAKDWQVGRDCVAVLADLWQRKKVGRGFRMQTMDPMLFCIDRASGKVVQGLKLKQQAGAPGRTRPTRLAAAGEVLWLVYYDSMLGLRGP